jgi:hypothetical protein
MHPSAESASDHLIHAHAVSLPCLIAECEACWPEDALVPLQVALVTRLRRSAAAGRCALCGDAIGPVHRCPGLSVSVPEFVAALTASSCFGLDDTTDPLLFVDLAAAPAPLQPPSVS